MPQPIASPLRPRSMHSAVPRNGRCDDEGMTLVTACLSGDRRQIAAFDRLLRRAIGPVCARFDVRAADRADLHQRLLFRLLLDLPGRSAQLRSYRGTGSLVAWLRICAAREILGELRRRVPSTDELAGNLQRPSLPVDPERMALDVERRVRLTAELRDTVAGFEPQVRESLCAHLHGRSTRDLAARYGVHRVTITRWVTHARRLLRERADDGEAALDVLDPVDVGLAADDA